MNETSKRNGFKQTQRLNESILCVFIAFLLLLSCPVIKTVKAFVSGSDYAALNYGSGVKKVKAAAERIAADTCSSLEALMSDRIDGTPFNMNTSILPVAFVLITVVSLLSLALQALHERDVLTRVSTSLLPIAETPLYIRHRLLLI